MYTERVFETPRADYVAKNMYNNELAMPRVAKGRLTLKPVQQMRPHYANGMFTLKHAQQVRIHQANGMFMLKHVHYKYEFTTPMACLR